jgi:hypothetical protein
MRRWHSAFLALFVAAVVHVDWHLARPTRHRWSLAWSQHWLFAAVAFAVVGWLIARRWRDRPWQAAAAIVSAGVVLGQGVEPVLESLLYRHQLGYPAEPERWTAFTACLAAGVPALVAAMKLCRPRIRVGGAPAV